MNSLSDQQLLRDYAERGSEAAFAELVRRHVALVYSAALRMVCDAYLAEDVTQNAFIALAQKARQLADRAVLSGWLHRTAQNLASKAVRTDVRRRAREQEAAAMNESSVNESAAAAWDSIAPHLDAGLGELSETDRDALFLRYFEGKSAQEIARALGVSAEAAQRRVNRAVERLRAYFSQRGVAVGAAGLIIAISSHAIQAAPVGLSVTISAAATVSGTTVAGTAASTTTKTLLMSTLQKTLIVTISVVAIVAGVRAVRHWAGGHADAVRRVETTTKPGPTFHSGLNVATNSALADRSFVLLIFGADWCPPCQALKKEVLASREFLEAGGAVHVTEIDVDADEATTTRFGVSTLPTLFLLTADSRIVARQSGYLDCTELVRWIEDGRRRAEAGQGNVSVPGFKSEELVAKAGGN